MSTLAIQILVGLALVASLFGGGLYTGIEWEQGKQAKKELEVATDAFKKGEQQTRVDVAASSKEAAKRATATIATNKLAEEIIHETTTAVVYRDCRITDDGMRNLNELIGKTNSAISGP